ncbi:MAG: hypothetical protein RQ867_10685, partial [Mariprofundaceae bacterium]|nr:hypothetical protein [Mariprofundaceae bacterium]
MKERRSDFDVTNTVNVIDPQMVCGEVCRLLQKTYPDINLKAVKQLFVDFERLYTGKLDGYRACETPYHDMMHALDVALCTTRLLSGFDLREDRIGAFEAVLGVVVALLHDSGYIRKTGQHRYRSGAEMTKIHVTQSGNFLAHYLPTLGLEHAVEACQQMLHFTGYEIPVDKIHLRDTRLYTLGAIIGSADLLAQMSDRCYLEKCRDRLYVEFVASGLASKDAPNGGFDSPEDLLRKTPDFYR